MALVLFTPEVAWTVQQTEKNKQRQMNPAANLYISIEEQCQDMAVLNWNNKMNPDFERPQERNSLEEQS